MYDPQATLAVMQAGGEKTGEQLAGLFTVEAVQVDFILNHPAPASQVAQDGLRQPLAHVMRLIAAFETVLQANSAVQAFMQRRPFVGKMLKWSRRR